jgi:hypothetical protein
MPVKMPIVRAIERIVLRFYSWDQWEGLNDMCVQTGIDWEISQMYSLINPQNRAGTKSIFII